MTRGFKGLKVALVGASEAGGRVDATTVAGCGCNCVQLESLDAAAGHTLVLLDADSRWSTSGELKTLGLGRSTAPVVLLASPTTPTELVEAAAQAGIDDVILRPLQPAQLTERLAAILVEPPPSPRVPSRKGPRTVVLAGDDFDFRARLSLALEYDGCHVLNLPSNLPPTPLQELVRQAGRIDLFILAHDQAGPPPPLDLLLEVARSTTDRPVPTLVLVEKVTSPQGHPGVQQLARSTPFEKILAMASSSLDRPAASLRVAARVPFFCPVEFREAGGSTPGAWRSGFSTNVSPGGLFVRTLLATRPGSAVELKIHLSTTREELTATGVVAWSNPYPGRRPLSYPVGMGVQFLGAISRKLRGLIAACGGLTTAPSVESRSENEQP